MALLSDGLAPLYGGERRGHFEGGRWIADPPKPIEPMSITLTLDTSQFERKLAALAPGLSGLACACDELLAALKGAN